MRSHRVLLSVAALVATFSALHGQTAGVPQCPGCESNNSSQYVETPCASGERAFIRADLYRGDGYCQELLIPPYANACFEFWPCRQQLVTRIGKKGTPLGTMVYIRSTMETTTCGDSRTISLGGDCGVTLDVLLTCSGCEVREGE